MNAQIFDKATVTKKAKQMIAADFSDVSAGKYSIAQTQEPRSTVGKLLHWLSEYIEFLSIYDVPVDTQIQMVRRWMNWRYDMVRMTYIRHLKEILGEEQYELYLRRLWLCKRFKTISDAYVIMQDHGEEEAKRFLIERHIVGSVKNKFGSKEISFSFEDIKAFIRIYQDRGLFKRKANGETFSYEDFKKSHDNFISKVLGEAIRSDALGTLAKKESEHISEILTCPVVKENALEFQEEVKKRAYKSVKALYHDSHATREAKRDAMRRGIEFTSESFSDLKDPEMTDEEKIRLANTLLVAVDEAGFKGQETYVNISGEYDSYIERGEMVPWLPADISPQPEPEQSKQPQKNSQKTATSSSNESIKHTHHVQATDTKHTNTDALENAHEPTVQKSLTYEYDRAYSADGLDSIKLREDNKAIKDPYWAFIDLKEADENDFDEKIPVGDLIVTCDPRMYSAYRKIGKTEYRFIAELHPHPLMQTEFDFRRRELLPDRLEQLKKKYNLK